MGNVYEKVSILTYVEKNNKNFFDLYKKAPYFRCFLVKLFS